MTWQLALQESKGQVEAILFTSYSWKIRSITSAPFCLLEVKPQVWLLSIGGELVLPSQGSNVKNFKTF
jgi:hypothetical protein